MRPPGKRRTIEVSGFVILIEHTSPPSPLFRFGKSQFEPKWTETCAHNQQSANPNLPPLIERAPGGDERPAPLGGFDAHRRQRYERMNESTLHRSLKDLDDSIESEYVLVVEDIVDSGLTLNYLLRNLRARGPASLEVLTLLSKPDQARVDVPLRYHGFAVPNVFVVGYGLDFAERYRNLPYVGTLKAEVIARA
jgi:hypothetical protein